jgi:hypothetical protein
MTTEMFSEPDPPSESDTPTGDSLPASSEQSTAATVVDLLGFLLADPGRAGRSRQLLRTMLTGLTGAAGLLVLSVLVGALLDSSKLLPLIGAIVTVLLQSRRCHDSRHRGR